MPLIHFTFGSYYRDKKYKEQTDMFLNYILLKKTLKSFTCPEFIPLISEKNSMYVPLDQWVINKQDNTITINPQKAIAPPPVDLMPFPVHMISFVNISFKKLKLWKPSEHYGKLGIAFTNDFKIRNYAKQVSYYDLLGLEKDYLVKKLNISQDFSSNNPLFHEIISYRKPSTMWEEFYTLFGQIEQSEATGYKLKKTTYSRYPIEYNFKEEKEFRIVTKKEGDFIKFNENDILAIIVPDSPTKEYIKNKLFNKWDKVPNFIIYPH